ncbi:ATPase, T2SS/T4P/T4SS family [Pannus brasiliensis CCIBt3594]|uniref:ATPase, T2SS/T4P/T4SS family n=1 Tax=Pannus brasiliensis CCIBt3594 TaxID=1427578 RepID=A0AAW9QMG2_9CHRO
MTVPNERSPLPPFANQLIQSGYITLPQLQQALIEKQKTNRPLIEILPIITGRPVPLELLQGDRGQQLARSRAAYGVECLDPETEAIDWPTIEHLFKTLLPFEICRRYQILPLHHRDSDPKVLSLAMVDPANGEILDDLRRILRDKDLQFDRRVILSPDYQKLIESYRTREEESATSPLSESHRETLVDVTDVFEDDRPARVLRLEESAENLVAVSPTERGPIVTLVMNLLVRAIENKASEIYLEPEENELTVRFRQDGLLRTGFEPIPGEKAPAVLSCFKTLANLEAGQPGQAGRGRITRTFSGRRIDFHVHTRPSRYGETIVLRVFDSRSALWSLDELIPIEETREKVRALLERPAGALLLTSPAAGGRSTTFYSLLANRHQAGLSIATVENPIERVLNGVAQVAIEPAKGVEYRSVLRSLSARGVKAIGIDHLDDPSIASEALGSLAAGHLVLSCLTADSAPSAIARLVNLTNPRAVADTLIGAIDQRLLRRVCPVCRLKHLPSAEELSKFGLTPSERSTHFYKANALDGAEIERARDRGRLCRHCNGSGYQGQIAAFEVIAVSPRLKASIAGNAGTLELETIARAEGFTPLIDYALELVARGETTLEEVDRVLGDRLPVAPPLSPTSPNISNTVMQRIEKLERLIEALATELQGLKREIGSVPPPAPHPTIVYEQLKESPAAPTESGDWAPDKETMVANTGIYEELTDPGDWEQLRKEIDPARDTIVSANSIDDDPSTWEVDSSFRSVPDPW